MLIGWQLYALSGIVSQATTIQKCHGIFGASLLMLLRWCCCCFCYCCCLHGHIVNKVEKKLKLKLILNEFVALTRKNSQAHTYTRCARKSNRHQHTQESVYFLWANFNLHVSIVEENIAIVAFALVVVVVVVVAVVIDVKVSFLGFCQGSIAINTVGFVAHKICFVLCAYKKLYIQIGWLISKMKPKEIRPNTTCIGEIAEQKKKNATDFFCCFLKSYIHSTSQPTILHLLRALQSSVQLETKLCFRRQHYFATTIV